MKNFTTTFSRLSVVFMMFMALIVVSPASVSAMPAPSQAECTSGSTTYTWDGEGITPPTISGLSVDGEDIVDPTSPEDGSLGASICANVEDGRRTGLFVYRRDGVNNDMDLTGAVTPDSSSPITADSEITITIEDMADLAEFYSFSLVHGYVTNWETSNLGTADASLTITLKPVRTPSGSGPDFEFCTATPPNCNAETSEDDVLSASLDMTFDQTGYGSEFTGAYFGLTGAMGGWVEAQRAEDGSQSLVATLGAPHFLEDGTTLNTGSLQAFLPTNVLEDLLELPPGEVDTSSLAVTRTEGGDTEEAPFTISTVEGGVVVGMNDITFSSPAYTISKASADSTPGLPDTGNPPVSSNTINPLLIIVPITLLATFGYILRRVYATEKI